MEQELDNAVHVAQTLFRQFTDRHLPPLTYAHLWSHPEVFVANGMAKSAETTSEVAVRTPRRGDDHTMVLSFSNARERMEKQLLDAAGGDLELLALLMARIAKVADKSGVVFSESLKRVIGTKTDFDKRAVLFSEKPRGDLEFSLAKVALLARGRAQVNVRDEDIAQYAALAEYVCSEIFTHAATMRHDAGADYELTRADSAFSENHRLSRCCAARLGFGIEGQ